MEGFTAEQFEVLANGLQTIVFSLWCFFGVSVWYRW